MAKRGKGKPKRRNGQKKLNLLLVGESVIMVNVISQGFFNCNIVEFITGRTSNAYTAKVGMHYNPSLTDTKVTLPEMLGIDQMGTTQGQGSTPTVFKSIDAGFQFEQIKKNLQANGVKMAVSMVAIPVAFRVGLKLTTKPRATVNRMLTYTKVGVKI